MTRPSQALKGSLFVLAAALLWGTTGTAQTFLPASVSSLSLGAVRLAVASLALLTPVLLQGGLRLREDWSWKTAVFAGAGIALSQLSFLSGVRLTGVAVGTIVTMGSVPIFAAVLDYFLQREKLSRRWYFATLLSLTGVILLALGSESELKINPLGILLTMLSGFSYAVMTLANKRLIAHHPPLTVMAVSTTIAALLGAPLLFLYDLSWLGNPGGLLVALHLGLITTALGYILFARGLKIITVHNAATLTLAEPLTAALLGLLVVGEVLTLASFSGMALIFFGLLILTYHSKTK